LAPDELPVTLAHIVAAEEVGLDLEDRGAALLRVEAIHIAARGGSALEAGRAGSSRRACSSSLPRAALRTLCGRTRARSAPSPDPPPCPVLDEVAPGRAFHKPCAGGRPESSALQGFGPRFVACQKRMLWKRSSVSFRARYRHARVVQSPERRLSATGQRRGFRCQMSAVQRELDAQGPTPPMRSTE